MFRVSDAIQSANTRRLIDRARGWLGLVIGAAGLAVMPSDQRKALLAQLERPPAKLPAPQLSDEWKERAKRGSARSVLGGGVSSIQVGPKPYRRIRLGHTGSGSFDLINDEGQRPPWGDPRIADMTNAESQAWARDFVRQQVDRAVMQPREVARRRPWWTWPAAWMRGDLCEHSDVGGCIGGRRA